MPLAAAALAFSSLAGYAEDEVVGDVTTTEGVIEAIDAQAHTVTVDGVVYNLPADYVNDDLKVNDKVSVEWKADGEAKNAVTISNESEPSGE